jgi:hypothetical protein
MATPVKQYVAIMEGKAHLDCVKNITDAVQRGVFEGIRQTARQIIRDPEGLTLSPEELTVAGGFVNDNPRALLDDCLTYAIQMRFTLQDIQWLSQLSDKEWKEITSSWSRFVVVTAHVQTCTIHMDYTKRLMEAIRRGVFDGIRQTAHQIIRDLTLTAEELIQLGESKMSKPENEFAAHNPQVVLSAHLADAIYSGFTLQEIQKLSHLSDKEWKYITPSWSKFRDTPQRLVCTHPKLFLV